MSWICRACSEIYADSYDPSYGTSNCCPKEGCNAELADMIHVDTAFAPIVAEFNKKGFEVEHADFGVPTNVTTYASSIVFCDFLLEIFTEEEFAELFSDLPDNWKFMICDGYPMIECVYFAETDIKKEIMFMKAHYDIAKFVDDIEEINY